MIDQPIVLHRYIRKRKLEHSGGKSNAQIGCVAALILPTSGLILNGEKVLVAYVGWSMCNTKAGDVYNKHFGYQTALGMATQVAFDSIRPKAIRDSLAQLDVRPDGFLSPYGDMIPQSARKAIVAQLKYVERKFGPLPVYIGTVEHRSRKRYRSNQDATMSQEQEKDLKSIETKSIRKSRRAAVN